MLNRRDQPAELWNVAEKKKVRKMEVPFLSDFFSIEVYRFGSPDGQDSVDAEGALFQEIPTGRYRLFLVEHDRPADNDHTLVEYRVQSEKIVTVRAETVRSRWELGSHQLSDYSHPRFDRSEESLRTPRACEMPGNDRTAFIVDDPYWLAS